MLQSIPEVAEDLNRVATWTEYPQEDRFQDFNNRCGLMLTMGYTTRANLTDDTGPKDIMDSNVTIVQTDNPELRERRLQEVADRLRVIGDELDLSLQKSGLVFGRCHLGGRQSPWVVPYMYKMCGVLTGEISRAVHDLSLSDLNFVFSSMSLWRLIRGKTSHDIPTGRRRSESIGNAPHISTRANIESRELATRNESLRLSV